MTSDSSNILIVEDSPSQARIYQAQLQTAGHNIKIAETGSAAEKLVNKEEFDCILLDLGLPDMNGNELLDRWQKEKKSTSVVVITANGSINTAVESIKLGAFDFLTKPFSDQRLMTTVNNALANSQLKSTVQTYQQKIDRNSFCEFVGSSLPMQSVYHTLESAANSKASVFITGESGTGKELAANAIHKLSPRSSAPFIAINCSAIPENLMESELFGHVKGAFTGATSDRDGVASLAHGGTLFLDEICEMDVGLQAKLLRFIQLGTYQKVGGKTTRQADIRFVTATNKDPLEQVRLNKFREDLYYRLHVVPVRMPALRERSKDVEQIAYHFLETISQEEGKAFKTISNDAMASLLSCDWPGNVRELENTIRNIIVLNDGSELDLPMLQNVFSNQQARCFDGNFSEPQQAPLDSRAPLNHGEHIYQNSGDRTLPLWQVERDAIEGAIENTNGNIQKAARVLEISPSTIYRKREHWLKLQSGN